MEKKCILIVEDDPATRESIQHVLQNHGYATEVAANGEEGIAQLQAINPPPAVILLDLMMPGMNGWEFLDFQRNSKRVAGVPVIVCSAYTESAKAIKPSAVIEKPVQLEALLKAVKAFCE
jgi:CheY-like chemotaxis protein